MNTNKTKFMYFTIGIFAGILLTPLTNFVNADSNAPVHQVKADYYLDGSLLKIGSNNYSYMYNDKFVPTTISYKNTLYCPVDLMAKLMGKNFLYDTNLRKIIISKNTNNTSTTPAFMSDIIKPNISDCKFSTNGSMKINSVSYTKGYMVRLNSLLDYSTISFNLDKKYTELNGFIGLNDGKAGSITLTVLSDKHVVYSKKIITNSPLEPLSLKLTNVHNLTFKFEGNPYGPNIDLVNFMIK